MIAHLDGDYETVDYNENRRILLYDNMEDEEYPIHWHNAIEIIMPLINPYSIVCDGHEYRLEERDIIIVPAGTLHCMKAQPGRRLILLFDSKAIDGNPTLSEFGSILAGPTVINSGFDREFISELNGIIKDIYILYSEFGDLTEVKIYLDIITLLLKIKEYMLNSFKYGENEEYADGFRKTLKFIERNYMHDITLDELADMAGYSKYHFSRLFKKYSGSTFITYLNQRRIKAAEMHLLNESLSVTNVAMQVGFSSLTTFNRVFKDIKGCTPSEFRKLYIAPIPDQ